MNDWLSMTASDLGRAIATGEICPVDLAHRYLEAIKADPLHDRIYARVTEARALAEAEAPRYRLRSRQSPRNHYQRQSSSERRQN